MSTTLGADNTPFFLLGCVRSGTTLLRDLLRSHPRLECPEETHFFRWPDPFGSPRYRNNYRNSALLKAHRKLDGLEEFPFHYILNKSKSRREMMVNYGRKFLELQGNPSGRWFDKTPQNVYGALLIDSDWPDARYIHIHRHPLNVVASLVEGAVMPEHDLNGAVNYWNEAIAIVSQFKRLVGDRLLEIDYQALTNAPEETLADILNFLNESPSVLKGEIKDVHPEKNKYKDKLNAAQIAEVLERTQKGRNEYGYSDSP